MILLWKIRYLDRNDRQFKDRYRLLDTENFDPVTRAALDLVSEAKTTKDRREILRFKHLFTELEHDQLASALDGAKAMQGVSPGEYFEDETGAEITLGEIRRFFGDGAEVAERPRPVPLAEVSLNHQEIRLLGYFARDYKELADSTLMKEGPGTASRRVSPTGVDAGKWTFGSALTDEEIRSVVTVYRRLYMQKEPASLGKAIALFVEKIGDHPFARFVSGLGDEYQRHLQASPEMPFCVPRTSWRFSTKRLIDVFLYTKYAHQPDEKRQKQYRECLAEVRGDGSLLAWAFLHGIWASSIHIINVGRAIDSWFQTYCSHHGVTPDVLGSVRHEAIGLGSLEKAADRKARLFRQKVEELELELWKRAGRPEGGPVQFRDRACSQLSRALGDSTG